MAPRHLEASDNRLFRGTSLIAGDRKIAPPTVVKRKVSADVVLEALARAVRDRRRLLSGERIGVARAAGAAIRNKGHLTLRPFLHPADDGHSSDNTSQDLPHERARTSNELQELPRKPTRGNVYGG